MAKWENEIKIPFAEEGEKGVPLQEDDPRLVSIKQGFTQAYSTPVKDGGEFIKRETINRKFNEVEVALKEVQEKAVLGVNTGRVDENGIVHTYTDLTKSGGADGGTLGVLPLGSGGTGRNSSSMTDLANTIGESMSPIRLSNTATTSTKDNIAIGTNARAELEASIAIGKNAIAEDNEVNQFGTIAIGYNAYADGKSINTNDKGHAIAIGRDAKAYGSYSTAIGEGAIAGVQNATTGHTSTAIGANSKATGTGSTALGRGATASGNVSTALGVDATASGTESTALGRGATASGADSTALGRGATASGIYSTALGRGATASGNVSTALGVDATASGADSTALGRGATASGIYSTALGSDATASGTESTALGMGAKALNDGTAIGYNAKTEGVVTLAIYGSRAISTDRGIHLNKNDNTLYIMNGQGQVVRTI